MKSMTVNRARILFWCRAAVIAAMYVTLTEVSNLFGLAGLGIQVRLSEALCVLPFFTGAAIPGLFVGCFLSNLFIGAALPDLLLGPLVTLGAAGIAYAIRRMPHAAWFVWVPNCLLNCLCIPVLAWFCYSVPGSDTLGFWALAVIPGECLSCLLGIPLYLVLRPAAALLFGEKKE